MAKLEQAHAPSGMSNRNDSSVSLIDPGAQRPILNSLSLTLACQSL